ncbi:S41 family peptidase [Terracidiphilus gabretensis]|uniref:S41 family peptidase n=1 Tax=Terracidiphilus gabretensis TaxID=1577687 RepID=UPI00071C155E|nr:S41 family peptidase [Terracidiphilus gabretensis]
MPIQLSFARVATLAALCLVSTVPAFAENAPDTGAEHTHRGYYRYPAVHGETIVFTSEGDLWTVGLHGGTAQRLTTAPGTEQMATISPDGRTVAFLANYEGPSEIYTMPIAGGLPERRTWEGSVQPAGWSPDGKLLISTERYSTLPGNRLALIDTQGKREILPLAEAAEGTYSGDGKTLFFTRWTKQWSETKRYKGGFAESIWKFDGEHEAVPLTADFAGTSAHPMFWKDRVYFLSDRDGIMNVWSMDTEGKHLKQESHQKVFDVQAASLSDGHIVYASGADLWQVDPATGSEQAIPITLQSDFDQMREHWVKKPTDYLTEVHLSPDGSSAVFTARGEVYVIPAKPGRIVKVASNSAVRYREAHFLPDGKSIVTLSTESGETEFWKYPANGVGAPEQWTRDAKVLRWDGVPSPDGRWLAHWNKDQELWLYDIKGKQEKRIAQSMNGDFGDINWSPDSKWLTYSETANNSFQQIKILNVDSGKIETITSDRYNSGNAQWSSDGKWLYFLSDRSLETTVPAPWGPRAPEPHFDRTVKIYQLALTTGLRSPFLPDDELHKDGKDINDKDAKKEDKKDDKKQDDKSSADKKDDKKSDDEKKDDKKDDKKDEKKVEVKIDFTDVAARVTEVPVHAGNYGSLQLTEKRLCWISAPDEHVSVECLDIANKGDEPDTVLRDVSGFEISQDRKKMLVAQSTNFYIFDSDVKDGNGAKAKSGIDLSRWSITTNPREEFHGLFLDAWRLERDYFYDRNMQGVNWPAMRDRYLPLVDRVSDRDELNAVIAQMVAELSALHTFVSGGDARKPSDHIDVATLGARLKRDEKAGGYVVEHVYEHDPDLPNQAPPLAKPESAVKEGEVITSIDGTDALSVPDERVLLRGKAGTQVLLHIKNDKGEARDVIAVPISANEDSNMRYSEWEYTRRTVVDKQSNGTIGYVHLQAMGSGDINQWAREFYPVFDRQGLIIDMRHNHGGNIDSWLLEKLLRQAWFYFQGRVGNPTWNMQYAFRGHVVVLCDHETASDGEAFSEGFRRLKLGKVIGMRTWGGEIWLSGSNVQADNGVATAAETGVYADGKWLIEGRGVEPDIVVDNLPHSTDTGDDAQLNAALKELEQEIKADPRPVPPPPPHPNKSFHN